MIHGVQHPNVIDRVGQRNGRLLIIARQGSDSSRIARWLMRCDCGTEVVRRFGKGRSCGAGEPRIEISAHDAAARALKNGDAVRVFNDRGSFRAKAIVGDSVKPGVVVAYGIWWNRYTDGGANCNAITSTALTDQGRGATFFDNLVEVESQRA